MVSFDTLMVSFGTLMVSFDTLNLLFLAHSRGLCGGGGFIEQPLLGHFGFQERQLYARVLFRLLALTHTPTPKVL